MNYNRLAADLAAFRPYVAKRSTREQRAQFQVWRDCRFVITRILAENDKNFDSERFIIATEK